MVQCMQIQVLEIKKSESELPECLREIDGRVVVYLYLVNYGRSRPEEVNSAISGFLSVSPPLLGFPQPEIIVLLPWERAKRVCRIARTGIP